MVRVQLDIAAHLANRPQGTQGLAIDHDFDRARVAGHQHQIGPVRGMIAVAGTQHAGQQQLVVGALDLNPGCRPRAQYNPYITIGGAISLRAIAQAFCGRGQGGAAFITAGGGIPTTFRNGPGRRGGCRGRRRRGNGGLNCRHGRGRVHIAALATVLYGRRHGRGIGQGRWSGNRGLHNCRGRGGHLDLGRPGHLFRRRRGHRVFV